MSEFQSVCLNELPVAMLLCNELGQMLACNQKARDLLGEALIGGSLDGLLAGADPASSIPVDFRATVAQMQSKGLTHCELRLIIDGAPASHINLRISAGGKDTWYVEISDVSEITRLLEAYDYKENILETIVETSVDALIAFDAYDCIELFSPAAERMFGHTAAEMILEDVYALFHPLARAELTELLTRLKDQSLTQAPLVIEHLAPVCATGEGFPATVTLSKSQRADEALYVMVIADKRLFNRFINSINDAYLKTDDRGVIVDVNAKAESLFEMARGELINRSIESLGLHEGGTMAPVTEVAKMSECATDDDFIALSASGRTLVLNVTLWPQEMHNVVFNNLIVRDITQKRRAEQQLIESAYTDSLTKLSNRLNFSVKLNESVERAQQSAGKFALLSLDIDKFKDVNEAYGHNYGDDLLKASASRLTAAVRSSDLISRMGGDEFTIIVQEFGSSETLLLVAERILEAFRRKFCIQGKCLAVSTSIGIAVYPDDATTAEALYKAADMAMYAAKRGGKDAHRRFTHEMAEHYERQKSIERALAKAIENEELSLHFQPKLCFSSQSLVGFEALLRWRHPQFGAVSPAEFIPIAEDSGVIVSITQWVLKTAMETLNRWDYHCMEGLSDHLTVSVNISAHHFRYDVLADVEHALAAAQFDPSRLEIEITESVLLDHTSDVVDALNAISALGVQISLDDFGTGYSSLQYLKYFKLDTIKIDRSFVRDIERDQRNLFIVDSIIAIGQRLDLKLVAEGVETEGELQRLVELGCDVFQGFLYSKPLPEDEALRYIEHLQGGAHFQRTIALH